MTKKFLILAGMLLFMPVFCFGAISYERSPSGFTIRNPVTFSISGLLSEYGEGQAWNIEISGDSENWFSPCFTNDSEVFQATLPIADDYTDVEWWVTPDLLCASSSIAEGNFETNGIIFEVVPYYYLPLTSEDVGSTADYITDLFSAIGPFIWLFIGVPLGFVVIRKIIKILPKSK